MYEIQVLESWGWSTWQTCLTRAEADATAKAIRSMGKRVRIVKESVTQTA